MSQIAPVCQQIFRGHDCRNAKVEIHAGLLDTVTRQPVDRPEIDFLGQIDGAPIDTPGAGGNGAIRAAVVSDAIIMLTRKNPRKRSYEGQKRRSGDELGLYSNGVGTWKIYWGESEPA